MKKNKVLVTGAGGYIGCVLVPKLLEKGHQVVAVDRFFFGIEKLAPHDNLTIIKEDARCIKEELFQGIDAVIDLVAVSNDASGEMFNQETWQINHEARARTAKLAKKMGVKQYILPSSCSLYGFQDSLVTETSEINPLTTYAKATAKAEKEILPLADDDYVVTILRQATVFGVSPRMRLDLVINGMTYGAWLNKKLPLMRDGKQYRPMVHIQDTTDVMCLLLETEPTKINGQVFNVGGDNLNCQIAALGQKVVDVVSERYKCDVPIEWYGDPDHRSYQVSFAKIKEQLGWQPSRTVEFAIDEILQELESGKLTKTPETITLDWYKLLTEWDKKIQQVKMYDGILGIK